MNIDNHAVLVDFGSNPKLQAQVAEAGIAELEEWIPRFIDSLRGKEWGDTQRVADSLDALFGALAERDVFLVALLAKIVEVIPENSKIHLCRALAAGGKYPPAVRELCAAIADGRVIRDVSQGAHAVTFRRGQRS